MSRVDAVSAHELDEGYRRATLRLIPFLVFLFILAWIDRVNVGFAKLQMLSDLKFSEAVYGFGAGIFFIGYFLFEVPSNLLLERIGARKTLARITILWGLASMSLAFVQSEWPSTPSASCSACSRPGSSRRGALPDLLVPEREALAHQRPVHDLVRHRGRGRRPARRADHGHDGRGLGLANWQWLFILEGIPSLIAGAAVLAFLPDRPKDARWLSPKVAATMTAIVEAEGRAAGKEASFKVALRDGRVWLCALIYFCIVSGNATIAFWTPSIIKEIGVSGAIAIGFLAAVPFIAGTIAMVWTGAHSDRTGERRLHCAVASLIAAAGLAATGALIGHAVLAFVALTVAAIGILAAFPVFWSLPQTFLAGTAAAGGIAAINSIGNLAGFVAPYVVGLSNTLTGTSSNGLYVVAGFELLAGLLVLGFARWREDSSADLAPAE